MSARAKRQNVPSGSLYVVATPIGNLQDITQRAIAVLGRVSRIYCEDTRRTAKLMAALKIRRPLVRLDAHATQKNIESAMDFIEAGESAAFVSDAGTPGVSDPGSELVTAARGRQLPVIPLPGASAVTTLLSVSGMDSSSFCFRGFFPRKSGAIKKEIEFAKTHAKKDGVRHWIYFESPKRIIKSLQLLDEILGESKVRVVCAKELTKAFETIYEGTVGQVLSKLKSSEDSERGEWCFLLEMSENESTQVSASDNDEKLEWLNSLELLLDCDVSASRAAKEVSRRFGVPKNKVYRQALDSNKNKNRKRT